MNVQVEGDQVVSRTTIERVIGHDGKEYRTLPKVPFMLKRRTLTVNGRDYKVVEMFIPRCSDGKPRILLTRSPYSDLTVEGQPNYFYHVEPTDDTAEARSMAMKKCIDRFVEHHTANP